MIPRDNPNMPRPRHRMVGAVYNKMADDEDGEVFPSKKKIHVNAASLVDLKAALYSKQQEVKRSSGQLPQVKKVSDKTASIWRRDPKKSAKKGQLKNTQSTSTNSSSKLTPEEEADLNKSKAALEAKAKLYDKLSKRGTISSDDEEDPEEGPRYMVDFQRKLHEETNRNRMAKVNKEAEAEKSKAQDESEYTAQNSDEEWVEYIDSLGRSRSCMKKDLQEMKRSDENMKNERESKIDRSPTPELLSEDMARERERLKWEKEALMEATGEEETYQPVGPVHYQNVQHNEVRTHGVGYYGFSADEEKRQEQLKTLNNLRDSTIDQRLKREKIKEKRKAVLEAKLAKVKQRKLKQGEEGESLSLDVADFNFESKSPQKDKNEEKNSLEKQLADEVARAREKVEELERSKHVRPWDKGKVNLNPIQKRKKELRDKRPNEFAPPSFYYKKEPKQFHRTNQEPAPHLEQPISETQTDVGSSNIQQTETQSSTQSAPMFPFPMYYPMYYPYIYPPPQPPST